MDPVRKSGTSDFVRSVADLGGRLSAVLHNHGILNGVSGSNLPPLVGNLDATVHCLNQLYNLLKHEDSSAPLLNDGGVKYIEALVEEIAIAIDRLQWSITGENRFKRVNSAKFWRSPVSTNELGQKTLLTSDIDEPTFSRDLKNGKGRLLSSVLSGPVRRLEYLQLLMLLAVQVMTVEDMTKKLPSSTVDLARIIEYHSRIVCIAQKVRLASSDGPARHAKSYLSVFSYTSDSDSGSDSSSVRVVRRGPPPPPPPGWKPFVAPRVPIVTETSIIAAADPSPAMIPPRPAAFCPDARRSVSPPRLVEIKEETNKPAFNVRNADDSFCYHADRSLKLNPPSYCEKDSAVESNAVSCEFLSPEKQMPLGRPELVRETLEAGIQEAKIVEHDEEKKVPGSISKDPSTKIPTVENNSKSVLENNGRLLNSQSSGLGLKLKSLFRSKSSLEAEMKRTLSDTKASLKAFIVQHRELRKVPHSAFHSLEYTHMRTILGQLKDNTWFKIFSDLTDAEHDTMESLLRKFPMDGKWFQRELVVLKIMQQNKYNAWMRVMEDCMGIEWGKPHHENHRIILAIVRETECEPEPPTKILPSVKSVKAVDYYDAPPVPRVPEPLSTMTSDKMLVDLDDPGSSRLHVPPQRGSPASFSPPERTFPPPPPGWVGPPPSNRGPPPPPPPGWFSRPPPPPASNDKGALSPSGEIQLGHSEVMPNNPVTAESAREALTSYEAFTFRPALQQQSPLGPLVQPSPRTWSRCFITREREETKVLIERVEKFRLRGISIIDLKVQLSEPQAAQLTNLVQELNQLESDKRFEHKMLELSMFDRERGPVWRQTADTNVDVIHVIMQRALKQGVNPIATYNILMNRKSPMPRGPPPAPRGPPPPPPPCPPNRDEDIIIIDDIPRRNRYRTRSIVSSSYLGSSSDSDSTTCTVTTATSGGYRRRPRYRYRRSRGKYSDSDSGDESEEEVRKARWKFDPVSIRFSKKEKGKDVVQLLLERWTPTGDGKGEVEEDKEDANKKKERERKKKRSRRRRGYESSSTLADD